MINYSKLLSFIHVPNRPKFVWLKPCENCPSSGGRKPDPESLDYLSQESRFRRMRSCFACGWRPQGYCVGYYKKAYAGVPSEKSN